jgi:hypothetical protein
MKLREFRVREFRSVWDSGPIKVDNQSTCLVGKNEAGKTALLQALYRSHPIISADAVFDETYDYPKREVEDYRYAVENGQREKATVVEATYELAEDDAKVVIDVFGPETLTQRTFARETCYGKRSSVFYMSFDELAARVHLAKSPALSQDLRTALSNAANWIEFLSALKAAEQSEAVSALKGLIEQVTERGYAHYVFNSLVWPRAPKYLYFDEYYQMKGPLI